MSLGPVEEHPDYAEYRFVGFCPRCHSPLQESEPGDDPNEEGHGPAFNQAGILCRPCIVDAQHKAESYGGTQAEVITRAFGYMNEYREYRGREP